MKKYYDAGGIRVALRTGTADLNWLLGDHLGSTAITASSSGGKLAEVRYKAWGEDRFTSGTTPTTFRFTRQRQESGIGLYFYNARWYDSSLGRFTSPDSLVPQPGNVLSWDRYSYVQNNPVRYSDPSGHRAEIGTNNDDMGYEENLADYIGIIYDDYNIVVSNEHKKWNVEDVFTILVALRYMDAAYDGFRQRVAGSTLYFDFHPTQGMYKGWTSNFAITFYADSGEVPFQNIYHEFGHLIDTDDAYSKELSDDSAYDIEDKFVYGNRRGAWDRQDGLGYVASQVWDQNREAFVVAEQHSRASGGNSPGEEWADMWANYVIGNIDMTSPAGQVRFSAVNNVLSGN